MAVAGFVVLPALQGVARGRGGGRKGRQRLFKVYGACGLILCFS